MAKRTESRGHFTGSRCAEARRFGVRSTKGRPAVRGSVAEHRQPESHHYFVSASAASASGLRVPAFRVSFSPRLIALAACGPSP